MPENRIGRSCAYPLLAELPAPVNRLLTLLEQAGYEAWVVGGFVRDALRGVTPHDADITTNAAWQTTKKLAEKAGMKVIETGTQHGTVTVICEGYPMEVTTYRCEGTYEDHRHPASVTFVTTLQEDLSRRDFTINAMAWNPDEGLVDPFDGLHDLYHGIIRCVGNPKDRFDEDALRIMRALRFASQLSFSLDIETQRALISKAPLLAQVSGERLAKEMDLLLCGDNVRTILLRHTEVLAVLIPQLQVMKGFDQHNHWHVYDVLEHTAAVVEHTPAKPLVRWAALFHDSGKPDTFLIDKNGVGHMPGHPLASIEHLRQAAKLFRFSRKRLHYLELLVRYHDDHPVPSRPGVRTLYAKLEENDFLFHVMCDLMRGDAMGQAEFSHKRVNSINEVERIFDHMKAEGIWLSVHDLPINGSDLIELGVPKGPQVGLLLNEVFTAVSKELIEPDRDALLAYATKLITR